MKHLVFVFSLSFLFLNCQSETSQTFTQMNTYTQLEKSINRTDTIVLGGGCFWCLEAVYEELEGIVDVVSGYADGTTMNPTYEEVCSGKTGHAEVVQIRFDSSRIPLEQILEMFWKCHDPTTINRQGADVGTQYRSIILYNNDAQKRIAEYSKQTVQREFENDIVTAIQPLKTFFYAEEYHQNYFAKNPEAPYCVFVIQPKLEKVKRTKK